MRYSPTEHSPEHSPHDLTYSVRKTRNRAARCNVYEITPDGTRCLERGNLAHTYFLMRGDFDIYSKPQLASALEGALGSLRITIDLGRTTFMDAAILGVLVATAARRRELHAARLNIINVGDQLNRLFTICRLQNVFCFEPDGHYARGPRGSPDDPGGA